MSSLLTPAGYEIPEATRVLSLPSLPALRDAARNAVEEVVTGEPNGDYLLPTSTERHNPAWVPPGT